LTKFNYEFIKHNFLCCKQLLLKKKGVKSMINIYWYLEGCSSREPELLIFTGTL